MAKLMVYAGPTSEVAPGTRTGGVPLVPESFAWPACATCAGPMQFLAQLELGPARLLSIFMCQNDPGLCDEWDAAAGGNHAYVFTSPTLTTAGVPTTGVPLLEETSAVRIEEVGGADYDEARSVFGRQAEGGPRIVLGQLGGKPSWLQGEEEPGCPVCGRLMTFAAQLEEGHNHRTAANYGGGAAYAFHCETCATGAFLWQQ